MTTTKTLKILVHLGADAGRADKRTQAVRYSDPRTCRSLSTTQVWSWNAGECDAIVVVTNKAGEPPQGHTVIRMGDTVSVIQGSVKDAMDAFRYHGYVVMGEQDWNTFKALSKPTQKALRRAAVRGTANLTVEQVKEIGCDWLMVPGKVFTQQVAVGTRTVGKAKGRPGAWKL